MLRRCRPRVTPSLARRLSTRAAAGRLDLEHFASIVGPANVITDRTSLEQYNTDWMRAHVGRAAAAVRPGSTAEVSAILAHCNERRISVVPQGGNTGLVGGSVPVADEVVLSLSRMNRILSLDELAGNLVCEAGCILQTLHEHVASAGFAMPLDLGAKGSCQIGGNVSTNAGGLRFLRYGSLHGTVLGLEVVLADGTVLDGLTSLRKDNTGYDLKQLFIGSEGTLGVVTACALALPRAPSSICLALLACDSYDAVLRTYTAATRHLGEEKLERFLEHATSDGCVRDGTIARDGAQSAAMWAVREGITEALARTGAVYKYDVSVPLAQLYDLVEEMRERLAPHGALVTGFGHLGDANLHLNICTPQVFERTDALLAQVEPHVFEWIAARRGSISAEHGIGVSKPRFLHLSKTAEQIELMRRLKAMLDPNGILNPGKVLPPR